MTVPAASMPEWIAPPAAEWIEALAVDDPGLEVGDRVDRAQGVVVHERALGGYQPNRPSVFVCTAITLPPT
ncbi:MAG: hypothetical protein KDG50_10275 [Chromatiales bacterium]|nr:hypothetical protein [Chromatiales bacterium]